jgi:arylsulfatase A-like enzyme
VTLPRLLPTLALLCVSGLLHAHAKPTPPHILIAIADDWSPHAGAYGTPWIRTPAFDRVAREGLLFTQAHTPNAKCAPSRACLLTGRNPWQLGAAANHIPYFPPEFKTWPEALEEQGWFTGHTQKGWGPGVATNATGQPRRMTGRPYNRHTSPPPTRGISPNDYAANFEAFLNEAPPHTPWLFWFGALEPHRSYEPGSGSTHGGRNTSDIDRVPAFWPDTETVRQDLLDYAYEVEHFDRHLARMLDALERRGALSNTLVIVTSDHGMPFPRVKGQAYPFANRVPLALRWPNGIRHPGRVLSDFVSLIDLGPTLIEILRLDWTALGLAPSPGRSLLPLLGSRHPGRVDPRRNHVLIGRERQDIGRPNDAGYPVRGILTDRFAYLHNFTPERWPGGNPETGYLDCDASPTKSLILQNHRATPADRFWHLCFGKRPTSELYDLRADPDCVHNLADDPAFQSVRKRLHRRLLRRLSTEGDPRVIGGGEVFDDYPHANPGHTNFHARFLRGEPMKTGWVDPSDFEPPP